MHKLRALCAAVMAMFALVGIHMSEALAQASQLPPGKVCFQATTGLTGMIGSLGTITAGTGGTSGVYAGVALTGGTGTGATANITVVYGSGVTAVSILNPGQGYVVGDVLTASVGVTGFSVPVASNSINSSLSGGTVGMYIPGTLTFKQTYQDAAQTILNTNPVGLDLNGCAVMFGTGTYRQVVYDSLGNQVWDQLTSVPPINPYYAGVAGGSANAITLVDPSFSGSDGQTIQFLATSTNSGAVTINPSGYGAISVVKNSATGPAALTGAEIIGGSPGNLITVTYSAAYNEFFLATPQASSAITGTVTLVSPTYCPYASLNGTTDVTACVQAAITAACSQTLSPSHYAGGILSFANGGYYIKSGVNIPSTCGGLRLVGQGQGNGFGTGFATVGNGTWIWSDNNCTQPIFNFYSDATQNYVYGGSVENMAFYNAPYYGARDGSVSCKYPLIQAQFGQIMNFVNLYSWLPYQFIRISGGIHYTIDNIYLDQVIQDSPGAFELTGTGTSASSSLSQLTRQDRVNLRNIFAGGSSALTPGHKLFNLIWWHAFSNTVIITNVAGENVGSALKIDCSGGYAADISGCPAFMQAYDLEAEGAGSNLLDAQDFQDLIITDSYFHCFGASFYGGCQQPIHLYNHLFTKTANATFKGGQADSGQHSGIQAEMQGLTVIGMRVFNNNLGASGGSDIGIDTPVGGDLSGQVVISNNTFCLNAGNTLTEIPVIFSAGLDYLEATGNMFEGCTSGVYNASGGTHVAVTPNVGP